MTKFEILKKQQSFFKSGQTKEISYRIEKLKALYNEILNRENEIEDALLKDLNKSKIESYMCEVGLVLHEIKYMIKHIKTFSKAKRVKTPLALFPALSYIKPAPKGNVLIMSPWNYPFLLCMQPLVDAVAAGNTSIVKPSAYSHYTSLVIKDIIKNVFDEKHVAVVLGGRQENQDLLELKFDHIFFTGGKEVGHVVMSAAEKHLTPITLELGGKSPCIVDKNCNIELSAKKIIFGKLINVGQTCIAPDYILVHESIKDKLVNLLIKEIEMQYGKDLLNSESYGKIISKKHFDKITSIISGQNILYGGKSDETVLKIEPTLIDNPALDSLAMTEEIFGPILPIISFKTKEDALEIINKNPTPLATYIFTNDKAFENFFTQNVQFGGGCVNDTIMHIVSNKMPFGGFGQSGMGAYHGKFGFDTFSHFQSVVKSSSRFSLNIKFRPYTKKKISLIKKFM